MKEKLTAYLAGGTVAIAMTTLLYSLTANPREGFDFHAADLLLPALVICAYQLGTLKRPSFPPVALGAVLILSSLWSNNAILTVYSACKLTLILVTFSSIRESLVANKKQFFIPITVMALFSLPWTFIQLGIRGNGLAWGFSGNPNITAGHAVILLLNTSIWLSPFWAVLLGVTGSRSAILALAVVLPFLPWKTSFIKYSFIAGAMVTLTFTFATYYRIIPFSFNNSSLAETSLGSDLLQDGRIAMAGDALERIDWIGSGYDTTTQWEKTNPHNIYLQLLQELGIIPGIVAISLLLSYIIRISPFYAGKPPIPHITWNLNPTLIAILAISVFDHYWLTTGQGMYLLAWALAQAEKRKEPEWHASYSPTTNLQSSLP